jgi:uncharacterized protein with PQ loop repeat
MIALRWLLMITCPILLLCFLALVIKIHRQTESKEAKNQKLVIAYLALFAWIFRCLSEAFEIESLTLPHITTALVKNQDFWLRMLYAS